MQSGAFRYAAGLVVALMAATGCHSNQPPPPATRPVEILKKPAIDLSRGGAGFPLAATTRPNNPTELKAALEKGYAERLVSPQLTKITIEPGKTPTALRQLSIDLTGNTVRREFVPKNPPKESASIGLMTANRLEYVADPLKYDTYSAGMRLQASNAELEMIPNASDDIMLMLTDCHTGRATFDLSVESLRQSLSSGVNIKRTPAFMIESVDLSLSSASDRSLATDATVHARVLFVPATFRLTGSITVDADFNVHFLDLLATGSDPAGMLIAEIVQAKLDKVNGKAAPLLKFPGDKIKVDDLKIKLTDVLTVDIGLVGTK